MPRASRRPVATVHDGRYPPSNHGRQAKQGWSAQSKLLDHSVEGASIAAMAPEDILDIERDAAETLRYLHNIRRSNKQERGAWIDEATNEPGARYAVNLWPSAGNPNCSSPSINRRQLGEGNQRKLLLLPRFESPFEHLRWNTLIS